MDLKCQNIEFCLTFSISLQETMMNNSIHKLIYLMFDMFPFLRHFIGHMQKIYQELINARDSGIRAVRTFTNTCIRKENKDQTKSRIFIDHFIDLEDESRQGNMKFDEKDTHYVSVDLLFAGVSTTSTFLTNLLGILVNHTSIQDKAHNEIIAVIGKRAPTIDNRKNTPYVEAVILEAFRYTSFVPLLLPHYTSCETDLNGYLIPKGTTVFPNVWSLHHDEKYWRDPWVFDPLRFLDENGILSALITSTNRGSLCLVPAGGSAQLKYLPEIGSTFFWF